MPHHWQPSLPVPPVAIPSSTVPSHPIPSHPTRMHPTLCHPIAPCPVPAHPMHPIHPTPAIPSHPIPSHPIPSHRISFHCVASHPTPSMIPTLVTGLSAEVPARVTPCREHPAVTHQHPLSPPLGCLPHHTPHGRRCWLPCTQPRPLACERLSPVPILSLLEVLGPCVRQALVPRHGVHTLSLWPQPAQPHPSGQTHAHGARHRTWAVTCPGPPHCTVNLLRCLARLGLG